MRHKSQLKSHIQSHYPHSDYNLAGLWSYDTRRAVLVSYLHGNLVMQSEDYVTKDAFYSFLGTSSVDRTIEDIYMYQETHRNEKCIKLISEYAIQKIKQSSKYIITEDRDNFDYILSVKDLMEYRGNRFGAKRNFLNRFNRKYSNIAKVHIHKLPYKPVYPQLFALFDSWEMSKHKGKEETKIEKEAMRRLLDVAEHFNLYAVSVIIEGKVVGFSINEIIQERHGVIHFEKADVSHVGIFEFIKQQSAIHFYRNGCEYINYEQDLGIEGLRKAKLSYKPMTLGKKFTIRPQII